MELWYHPQNAWENTDEQAWNFLFVSCGSKVLNASSILQHIRIPNKNIPKSQSILLLSLILKNITMRFRSFSKWTHKPSTTKSVADYCRGNKIKTSSEMGLYQSKISPQTSSLTLTLLNCNPHIQQGTADPDRATIVIYVYINKDEIQLGSAIWEQSSKGHIYISFNNVKDIALITCYLLQSLLSASMSDCTKEWLMQAAYATSRESKRLAAVTCLMAKSGVDLLLFFAENTRRFQWKSQYHSGIIKANITQH